MTAQHRAPEGRTESQTLGALAHQLTRQVPEPIRSEVRLAQAGVAQKGKRAGVGVGKNKVAEAVPPAPERAIRGFKDDIATVKGDHP